MTSSRATEHLVAPIETWLRQFDDLQLKTAPEDFLVGFGSIRKAFLDFYEEGTSAAPMQLLSLLAASEYTLAEDGEWAREHGVTPLQPLSPHWLPLVASRTPEFRLAAALNSLAPIETDDDVIFARTHMETIRARLEEAPPPGVNFDDEVGFTHRMQVEWRHDAAPEYVWDREDEIDGLRAILKRRLHRKYGQEYAHASRGRLPASIGDITAFIHADTDEGTFSRLAFVLAMIDLAHIETDFEPPTPNLAGIDPDWALLKLALSRPPLLDSEAQLPIERDIHILAIKGDRESSLEFARAHLRAHGLEPREDLESSEADFERIVAACAFPISRQTVLALRTFIVEGDQQ